MPEPIQRLTREIINQFLAALVENDAPPFIDIAADRCGLSRATVRAWFYSDAPGTSQLLADFKAAVRKVRGDWIHKAMAEIASPKTVKSKTDKGPAKRTDVASLKWILQRLDSENFDPAPAKADPADKTPKNMARALPPNHPDVEDAGVGLETPETVN